MKITKATYQISAVNSKGYPKEEYPSFMFIGRSNVGKSSLMNALLNAVIIPRWGITGAACTTLFTQLFIAVVAPLLFKETKEFFRIYVGCFKKVPMAMGLLKNTLKNK